MIVRFFQPQQRKNLYDAKVHSHLAGVLYFQFVQKELEQQLDKQKSVQIPDNYNQETENKKLDKVNFSVKKFEKLVFKFAFKVDSIVLPIILTAFQILKSLYFLLKDIFVTFIEEFSTLINDIFSVGKKIISKSEKKQVIYYGAKIEVQTKKISRRQKRKISNKTKDESSSFLFDKLYTKVKADKKMPDLFSKLRLPIAFGFFVISFGAISLLIIPLFSAHFFAAAPLNSLSSPSPTPFHYNSYYESEMNPLYPIHEFRLVVPKINLESNIVDNVDPNIEDEYRDKLQFGVAHAKGTYLPPENAGAVYLFAHSTDTILNIARYNAKFYSVRELESGDEIKVYFNGQEYKYAVTEKFIINPEEVDIVQTAKTDLILQTCWPPGTDWQRLIVLANKVGES